MHLKRRVMDPRAKDEISEALAFDVPCDPDQPGGQASYRFVPQYIYNYYPKGLRERCVGPHSKNLIGVTRFYPRTQPPLVIDFEPAPPDPWYREEKLQFFIEQGIAYVPLTLTDALSTEAFLERVAAAKRMAHVGRLETLELEVLAEATSKTTVEEWLQTPEVMASIDAETLKALQAEAVARGRPLTGVARLARLATLKTRVIQQLREDLKRGRLVDPLQRHREPAPSAQ